MNNTLIMLWFGHILSKYYLNLSCLIELATLCSPFFTYLQIQSQLKRLEGTDD